MADPHENPFRAPEPEREPIDFQDADDKPWLRSESKQPVIGPKLGLVIFLAIGVAAVFAGGYFFGRFGTVVGTLVLIAFIKASR